MGAAAAAGNDVKIADRRTRRRLLRLGQKLVARQKLVSRAEMVARHRARD